jgi:hypothetical protein
MKFGHALCIGTILLWVGFNEGDLKIFRPKVQEILNFYGILINLCHWKFNWITKMILDRKISWVISSHLDQ